MLSLGENPLTERGLASGLVGALSGDVPPPFAVRLFQPLPTFEGYGERTFDVDQTNHSVVVDERVVVKWLTPPPPMPQPAPEVFAHLTSAGFHETAPPYAALTRAAPDGTELLLALVTGYLPGARDGWEWCVDEAEAGRTAFATDLGHLAANLHAALSTFPVAGASTDDLFTRAEGALREALELTDGEDGEWLASREETLRQEFLPLTTGARNVIRIHGDFHVGQILQWDGGYAVIDFDGNPTVSGSQLVQPAARDVAQLTTSLEHVAQVAIRRRGTPPAEAARWAAEAKANLLAAYGPLDPALLRPFEVEQECRELIYAARHLPRWRYAPMGVLRKDYL
ncbi:phosphotransferase [Nonomuraea sp. NPDC050556]|uniref:phosphotransferase n=1 Tax=Nonomuraea sp. NPDC050556 TaxID=3364369 RepID=UPI0037A53ED9